MAEVNFSDEKQAKAWFETQSAEKRCLMSARAALRVVAIIGQEYGAAREATTLASFRAIITSAGRGVGRPADVEDLRRAAFSIVSAADSASTAAANPVSIISDPCTAFAADSASFAASAAFSDSAALSAKFAAWSVACADSAADSAALFAAETDSTLSEQQLITMAVWSGHPVPEPIFLAHGAFMQSLYNHPDWAFWAGCYRGMWDGTFRDWDLAIEVAKIPEEVWEGDDAVAKVAEAIREIEKRLATRVGPQLVKTSSGQFDLEDDVRIDDEPISFAIGQVEIALRAVLSGDGTNGFTAESNEAQLIRVACTEYRDQHSNVATAFWNACMGLQHNIGDVYPEDRSLISLQNTLYVSVEEMCANSDLIRDRIARLAALETRRYPTQEERDALLQLPVVVADDTTERANAEIKTAVEQVAKAEKPARVWRAKLVNWITTLSRGIDQGQKTEKKVNWLIGLGQKISGWFFDDEEPGGDT